MFGSFRRHQKWIWILGVVVIIPSFVWFFMPNGSGPERATANRFAIVNGKEPTINGQPIPLEEFNRAKSEKIVTRLCFGNGNLPEDEASKERLDVDTVRRVFVSHKLKELGIEVSDEAVARQALQWLRNEAGLASLERE